MCLENNINHFLCTNQDLNNVNLNNITELMINIVLLFFFIQATLKHDIELPSSIPELLMEKHANYLISYGTNKDEYVRIFLNLFCYLYI